MLIDRSLIDVAFYRGFFQEVPKSAVYGIT